MERAMLSEGGASGEAGNLDDSGMFSIQVGQKDAGVQEAAEWGVVRHQHCSYRLTTGSTRTHSPALLAWPTRVC